jgi:HEAT repeat protein
MLPVLFAAFLRIAAADPAADLSRAADPTLPEAARMEAFNRLVSAGTNDLRALRAAAADASGDSRRRWVAIRALGKVGGTGPRDTLLQLLNDPQPAVRAAAAQALGDLGDRTVHTALVPALQDPAVIVRAAAAEALGKVGDANAVPALAAAFTARDGWYRGSSRWVRRHYVVALGQIGDRSAIPTLRSALDDADTAVQAAAVGAFEALAGFDYRQGRSLAEQKDAWRRWAGAQGG